MVKMAKAPDNIQLGDILNEANGQITPRNKNKNEQKIDAIIKAVLTGNKTDLENLTREIDNAI